MDSRTRLSLLTALFAASAGGAALLVRTSGTGAQPATPSSLDRTAQPRSPQPTYGSGEIALVEVPQRPQSPAPVEAEPAREHRPRTRERDRSLDAAIWLRRALPDRYAELTLEEVASLANLDLRGAEITDTDLEHLRHLPGLESLSLRGTAVTDAGMFHLAPLNLSSLELRGTALTGVGLAQLPATRLEALHLTDTHVTGDDLAFLPSMPNLQVLKLNWLEVSDAHLERLSSYPALRHIELDKTGITGAGLERLMSHNPNVTRIELRDTQVSAEAIERLRTEYPECEFVREIPNLRGHAIR